MDYNTSTANVAEQVKSLMDDLLKWQKHIERALRDLDGMYTFNDVVAMVLRQELHLYDFDDCFFLMRVETFPGYKSYHCFLGGGNYDTMFAWGETLADIGRNLGCKKLSFSGRPGWTRRMKKHGWKHVLSTMQLEI